MANGNHEETRRQKLANTALSGHQKTQRTTHPPGQTRGVNGALSGIGYAYWQDGSDGLNACAQLPEVVAVKPVLHFKLRPAIIARQLRVCSQEGEVRVTCRMRRGLRVMVGSEGYEYLGQRSECDRGIRVRGECALSQAWEIECVSVLDRWFLCVYFNLFLCVKKSH